ncbi:MAG: hypothetical protein R3C68_17515 [Myxococcota bacterium]
MSAWCEEKVYPPEVRFAVELALIDLLAQRIGVPVACLLTDAPRESVAVCAVAHDPTTAGTR